jgi:hypothetical protein
MRASTIYAAALAVLLAGAAHAHGGGLNSEGCHNNRKTGDYHCHRASAALAQSTASIAPSGVQQKSGSVPNKLAPQSIGAPTCYVGPRGGTYTITKSGKKNYSGC